MPSFAKTLRMCHSTVRGLMNSWVLQEITTRLPGRVTTPTAYESTAELAGAMRRASQAHGKHEERIGKADPDWPDWYAEYMVREQAGEELPT